MLWWLIPGKVNFTNTAHSKKRRDVDYENRQLIGLGLVEYGMKFNPKLAKQEHQQALKSRTKRKWNCE